MFNRNREELSEWMMLFARRVLEFIFFAAWLIMAWILDEIIMTRFTPHGLAKLIARGIAFIFDLSTLYELLKLHARFYKRKRTYPPWWM